MARNGVTKDFVQRWRCMNVKNHANLSIDQGRPKNEAIKNNPIEGVGRLICTTEQLLLWETI